MKRKAVRRTVCMSIHILIFLGLIIRIGVEANDGIGLKYQPRTEKGDWESGWEDEWDDDWEEDKVPSRFIFRYNRVEGIFLGAGVSKESVRKKNLSVPLPYGFTGYSFGQKEVEYQIGLEMGSFTKNRLMIGGEYHHRIDTQDQWFIPDMENSLAAFFLKEDFHDFYLHEGYSFYMDQAVGAPLKMGVAYHYEDYDSLKKEVDWSLFGRKKHFRENPSMPAIHMRSLSARWIFDSRNSVKNTKQGWYVQFEGEYAGRSIGGEADFDRLLADVRRYQPFGDGSGVDLRIRLGSIHGDILWQKSFQLGGIGTLRGFPFKAFPLGSKQIGGNRMFLTQIEYRLGPEELYGTMDLGILENFNMILFDDIGWVDCVDPDLGLFGGFGHFSFSNLKNDVGLALADRNNNLRFEIARRTDTGHKPFVFYLRINRTF
jgi:hypothetical protein